MSRYAIRIFAIAAIILISMSRLSAEPKELTVLTYNTHLFTGVNPTIGDKMPNFDDEIRRGHIINKIKASNADIVALQEVWGDPWVTDYFIPGLHANYPYTAYMYKGCNSYVYGLDTLSHGVLLLSKWPISNKRFEPFPTFHPSCPIDGGCDNWANKGVWTATVDVNGMPIRVGVSHALTGPDDAKSKWEPDYVANSITSFQLNGEAYIFALKKDNTARIVRMEDYGRSWDEGAKKYNYGAGWKEVYKGPWSSDYRAVVSFELNGHPYLFSLKSGSDQAYVTRINDDPSTGWQPFGPYSWDKDFRPTAITSFQLNGQAYLFGLKTTWDQAWVFRVKTDPSTGEFNSGDPFEVFGDYSWSRWFGAITSFESNGRPWLYCLKSNYDQVYMHRINEDTSTGKLNRTNPFTQYGPFTQEIDRYFIGETITSFQLNGRAYIFGVKSGWDQAWLYRINPDPSTGLVSLGWKPWTRDYVAVESFEMNGHPYLFGLRNCCDQMTCCFKLVCTLPLPLGCDACYDLIPISPYALFPGNCEPCLRDFPGEAYLKRINDDPSTGWENLLQMEDIKIIRDETVVAEDGLPAIMMGDFNIHRGKYGIMDQLFRKAGAFDAYVEVHGTGEGGETTDWVENRLYQIFWEHVDPNDPDAVDRIDYVYFKPSGSGLRLVPTDANVIRDWKYYSEGAASDMDLSDHYPVVVKFRLEAGCPIPLKGDFDCDHVVGFPDLAILCSAWLSGPGGGAWDRACDISDLGDDFIGMKDFDAFALQWGSTLVVNVTQNTWYVDIQTAINNATNGDEIEVGPKTYYEAIDFKGKAIRLYSSGGQDVTTIDGSGAHHVVQCVSGEDSNTILEGFTITGGNACGPGPEDNEIRGAGMLNIGSSPTVKNCTFSGNLALSTGGGMCNYQSSPTLMNCTFSGNEAEVHGGGICNLTGSSPTLTLCLFSGNLALSTGGGIINSANSSPVMTDCAFTDNVAYGDGGGMINNSSSSPKLTNCTFTGNSADGFANGNGDGGGIHNAGSNPTLTNCIFSQNNAQSNGGGMYNTAGRPTLTNCIFYENTARHGSGGAYSNYNDSNSTLINCTVYQNWAGHGLGNWDSTLVVTNCIVWYNYPSEISSGGTSSLTVSYSNIYGAWSGTGNINEWPFFVDPDGGDLRLSFGSPCIDKGSNAAVSGITTDLDGNPRVLDGDDNGTDTVDMGAYEYILPVPMAGSAANLEAYCILAANWLETPWPRQP